MLSDFYILLVAISNVICFLLLCLDAKKVKLIPYLTSFGFHLKVVSNWSHSIKSFQTFTTGITYLLKLARKVVMD